MPEINVNKLPSFRDEKDVAQWTGYWHTHRRVPISGVLHSESLRKVSLQLAKLDYEKNEPITLMIESCGGTVAHTHQFEDTISMLNCPIDALVIGDCASMAVDIVQMCRRRLILPSARVLVHYVRYEQKWVCDDLDMLEVDIKYFRERMREVLERRFLLYTKRTGFSRERISELFRQGEVHETFFSAKQAVELNLVDEIVTDFKLFPRKPAEEPK